MQGVHAIYTEDLTASNSKPERQEPTVPSESAYPIALYLYTTYIVPYADFNHSGPFEETHMALKPQLPNSTSCHCLYSPFLESRKLVPWYQISDLKQDTSRGGKSPLRLKRHCCCSRSTYYKHPPAWFTLWPHWHEPGLSLPSRQC